MKNKISHPIFIISIALLIINDLYLKTTFHNELTGKLSDFAGLFAFPFLFSTLFPQRRKIIHILTAMLFLVWNSPLSQGIIDIFNNWNIPIGRTIDYTDNIALISIFLSYKVLERNYNFNIKPFFQKIIICISCFAFMATSLPPRFENRIDVDKEYFFNISKRDLVARLNDIQIKEVKNVNKRKELLDFNSETNVFHSKGKNDTIAILLDYTKISDRDTITVKTSLGKIQIFGNEEKSTLKVINIYGFGSINSRDAAIKEFEKRIVKKINKYK